jgi:acyl-CoA thioester hydrolase
MVVVQKSVAHPWQCDVLGHLTTRFYVAMFDDSSYHFLHTVFGWTGSTDDEGKLGWADVRHVTNYQAEVSPGDLLEVQAGMTKVGGKSITVLYEMRDIAGGDIVATQEVVCVLFDMQKRVAVAIPDDVREAAEKFL